MALAFKRAQADAEKAVEAANKKIADNYKTTVSPALIVDYDSIKAVEGVSKFNTNSQELPKNITLCNWVKEYADRFHSVWGDVQYRDKKHALPIMLQHVDKVILHLDDKSPAGKYNTYEVKAQGKDIHLHLHFDFTQVPQPLSLTDEKGGHVINALWAHLDDVANITYLVRKANQAEKDGSYLNKYKKELKEKAKKDIAFDVDFDSIDKLTGKGIESSNRPVVPNKARVINWMEDGDKGLMSVWWAIEKLLKDDLGREAFGESFKKVLVSVEGNSKETRGGPHKVVKDADTLRFILNFNLDNLQNTNVDHSGLAKEIEKML